MKPIRADMSLSPHFSRAQHAGTFDSVALVEDGPSMFASVADVTFRVEMIKKHWSVAQGCWRATSVSVAGPKFRADGRVGSRWSSRAWRIGEIDTAPSWVQKWASECGGPLDVDGFKERV